MLGYATLLRRLAERIEQERVFIASNKKEERQEVNKRAITWETNKRTMNRRSLLRISIRRRILLERWASSPLALRAIHVVRQGTGTSEALLAMRTDELRQAPVCAGVLRAGRVVLLDVVRALRRLLAVRAHPELWLSARKRNRLNAS